MDAQFPKLLQLGIIVEDVDKAVENYEKHFGIGPWRKADLNRQEFPGLLIDGKPGDMENKLAFCSVYGMEIELIQPISPSPYKTWLEEHGPGIHHIAVTTRDPFDKVLEQCKALSGKETWLHGQEPNIGMDFAYVDLRRELGLICELYNEDRSQQPGHEA